MRGMGRVIQKHPGSQGGPPAASFRIQPAPVRHGKRVAESGTAYLCSFLVLYG